MFNYVLFSNIKINLVLFNQIYIANQITTIILINFAEFHISKFK
jgi:hypothetical protein